MIITGPDRLVPVFRIPQPVQEDGAATAQPAETAPTDAVRPTTKLVELRGLEPLTPFDCQSGPGMPTAAPDDGPELTPFQLSPVKGSDPTSVVGVKASDGPLQFRSRCAHTTVQCVQQRDRLSAAMLIDLADVAQVNALAGGILVKKTPPVQPSGRQDLNLRPLDPQG